MNLGVSDAPLTTTKNNIILQCLSNVCGEDLGILRGVLSISQNIVMDLNNVMKERTHPLLVFLSMACAAQYYCQCEALIFLYLCILKITLHYILCLVSYGILWHCGGTFL